MLVEINDAEIKSIGERRYIRKTWKRFSVLIGIPLVAMFVCGYFSGQKLISEYLTMSMAVVFAIVYLYWGILFTKSGKQFLAQCKKESEVNK